MHPSGVRGIFFRSYQGSFLVRDIPRGDKIKVSLLFADVVFLFLCIFFIFILVNAKPISVISKSEEREKEGGRRKKSSAHLKYLSCFNFKIHLFSSFLHFSFFSSPFLSLFFSFLGHQN